MGDELMLPSDISGLFCWLKADALALSDADPVSTWDDSGAGNRDASGSGGARPTFQTNEINTSLPIVRFDGTDDIMTIGTFTLSQPFTVLSVAKYTVNGQPAYLFGTGTPVGFFGGAGAEATSYRMFAGSNGPTGTISADVFHLITTTFDGAGSVIHLDGSSLATGNPGAGGFSGTLGIGQRGDGSFPIQADVAELIFYDSALSAGNRNSLGGYIQTKYGITVAGATFDANPPPRLVGGRLVNDGVLMKGLVI